MRVYRCIENRYSVLLTGCGLLLSLLLSSCKAGQLFKAQEWSENYALLEGASSTSPLMTDGDVNTVGESGREIIITLPERKGIHRLVLRGINFKSFAVYAGGISEGDWQKIETVDRNRARNLDLRLMAATNKLRLRIGGTLDDERAASEIDPVTGVVRRQRKRARPEAAEIEVYGFRTAKPDSAPSEEPPLEETEPLPEVDIEDEPLF